MSTNPFARLKRLLPPSPVLIGRVVAHNDADDTSDIELPTEQGAIPYAGALTAGSFIRARGRTVQVGQNAFVRDGVVETQAPSGDPIEIVLGTVSVLARALVFSGGIPAQAQFAGNPFTLALAPFWVEGTPPLYWVVATGTLPPGLSLNSSTGVISGTPQNGSGAASVVIRATDARGTFADGPVSFLAASGTALSMTASLLEDDDEVAATAAVVAVASMSAALLEDDDEVAAEVDIVTASTAKWTTTGMSGTATLSESDMLATYASLSTSADYGLRSSDAISSKAYCEFELTSQSSNNNYHALGITKGTPGMISSSNWNAFSRAPNGSSGCGLSLHGLYTNGSSSNNSSYSWQAGDRIGVAVDKPNGKLWFRINGTWVSGDPAAGTSPTHTFTPGADTWYFAFTGYSCNAPGGSSVACRMYATAASQTGSLPSGFSAYG